MTLNEYLAAQKKLAFEAVSVGRTPEGARCDASRLAELAAVGRATMGTTNLGPMLVEFEFVFAMPDGRSEVLTVALVPPHRIVFLPVPPWVLESIWQGEVTGSHHFEQDARALLDEFSQELHAPQNAKWFERQAPKRRE
jgi:hypothetical protein